MPDLRLPPRSRWDLRSSVLLFQKSADLVLYDDPSETEAWKEKFISLNSVPTLKNKNIRFLKRPRSKMSTFKNKNSCPLYCTVLYCTVLYCTVLYCIVLYCAVLYCIVLYCTALYCTVLYCAVLYCTVLYCTVILVSNLPKNCFSILYISQALCSKPVTRQF